MQKRLKLANGQGRDRVRRLVVRLRKLQRRLNDLESRRQQHAAEAPNSASVWKLGTPIELSSKPAATEFGQEEHAFHNSRADWQADCMVHEQHLAAREAALNSQSEQLRHEATELAVERAALLGQHDQQHLDHQLRTATLDEQQSTLAAESLELNAVPSNTRKPGCNGKPNGAKRKPGWPNSKPRSLAGFVKWNRNAQP